MLNPNMVAKIQILRNSVMMPRISAERWDGVDSQFHGESKYGSKDSNFDNFL